jgi:hypothetical protein
MKHLLWIVPATLILSSCGAGSIDEKIVTQTKYTKQNIQIQERPKPVDFPDTEWFVVSEENFDEAIKKIEEHGGSVTFMAITPKGYENLSIGVAELRRYILQQKEIIAYYEKAIEGPTPKK